MAVASMSEPRAKMGLLVDIRYHLFSKQSVSFVRKVALPFAVSLIQQRWGRWDGGIFRVTRTNMYIVQMEKVHCDG